MLRRVFLSLALGLAASCAVAQTAPSPADVGISKGTPDVFKLKGHDDVWTPFGSVDPSTHVFAPGTNGSIAPNDCLKWGPGITSAGAACGSGGGSGGGGPLTIYTSHSGLVNNVTTPTGAWTVQQQGFYAPGDGGAATYQWSLTSYCTGGTSGAPTPADGVACVLPIGQAASTAGRYLLQLGNGIDVRQIGMVGDGVFDNSTLNATLMSLINPANTQGSQSDVRFPVKIGQRYTDYYFSQSFHVYRLMHLKCEGIANGGGDASTRLVFPAGIHGVVFDNYGTSPDGTGMGGGGMTSCGIVSKGWHLDYPVTTGSNATLTVPTDKYFGTWDFTVGDGVVIYLYGPTNSAPAVPAGTTVTAINAGTHTITPSSPVVSGYTGNGSSIWRLPVGKAFTVNTTSGSPTVTVTGGPSLLQPGDYVWSTDFPLGTQVRSVTGALGAQTVQMTTYVLEGDTFQNATASHTGGKMWILPAGLKMFVQTSLHTNYFAGFAWGLEMECSAWGTPVTGCNGSMAQENIFFGNLIGRLVIGDNSGASASLMNTYAYNSIADIAELGAVGSNYFAENGNSQEDSTSIYGAIGYCVNSNSSSFYGGYITTTGGYCTNGIGVATSPGGSVVFWNQIASAPAGAPYTSNAGFFGPWYFTPPGGANTQLCMNHASDTVLAWSSGNQSCGGPLTWDLTYSSSGFWEFGYYGISGGQPMWLTEGTLGNYTGYRAGNLALVNFDQGFLLDDTELGGGAPGPERLVDEGISVPTGTFHQIGDIHFNQDVPGKPTPFMAWTDTYAYYTNIGANIVAGTTTSVPSGCPNPALPVGTPILDNHNSPRVGAFIGTLASCTAGTLTFQAAAAANANSGAQIVFMQWRPAGPVANDAAGASWTLGNYLTLTPVALASLPATCTAGTFAVINNGVAAPVYNAAVGSTTGAATDPVFCTNGNVWTYH